MISENSTGQLKQLWQEAFGDSPKFIGDFFRLADVPEHCRVLWQDGTAAAALYWFDCTCRGEPMAYLYAVSTGIRFRHRGLCRVLLEETLEALTRRGYCAALLSPASAGLREMYRKMGFSPACALTFREASSGNTAVSVREVTPEAYTTARLSLLPPDGVQQSLPFFRILNLDSGLYIGPGFVLAARQDGDVLDGQEFLGDFSVVPGILTALGCRSGRFPCPGGTDAPVFIRVLSPAAPVPGYFGPVLD